MRHITLLLVFLALCLKVFAQTDWTLKKEEDGIKIFTGSAPKTNIKSVRAELTINATLSQLTGVMLDMSHHDDWVYNTKNSHLLRQVAPNDIIYYSEVSMPWPLTNRDVVAELNIAQDPGTKVFHAVITGTPGYLPIDKDKVRVPMLKITWIVTPIKPDQLTVDYVVQVDPGGSVPAWLVNSFSTKVPLETFKKLRALVSTPQYHNAHFDFIKD